jgi:hypothetical protein
MRLSLPVLFSFLVALTSLVTLDAHAAGRALRGTVSGCSTIRGLGADIYKNSKPVRACSAINCPIAYFERSPSLLVNTRGTPRVFAATLIDAKGGTLATCGQKACRDCSQGFRYVCQNGGGTNAIAGNAKKRAGSYKVYYKVGSQCVEIPDVGKCKGSVKGLCNQLLH